MKELSLLRIVAQGLVPTTAADSAHDVVTKMLATQGQLPSAVPHSLIVRTREASGSDVRREFAEHRLVRSWPFRGTLHIVAAEDHHWLRALSASRPDSWWERESARVGLTAHDIERAQSLTAGSLADGPISRTALIGLWREAGVAHGVNDADRARMLRLLFTRLHRDGTIVSGPLAKNDHLVIDAAKIPATSLARRIDEGDAEAIRGAHAEVARRYATARGPVTVDDLARWAGIGKGVAQTALDDAVDLTNTAAPAPGHAPLARSTGERLDSDRAAIDSTYYYRADLPDLLAQSRTAARRTLFLSAFDELHVGYKDRTCLADSATEKLICPGGNGMFRPLVIDAGRVVGVRPAGQEVLWVGAPSARVATGTARAIRAIERRLAA